VPLIITCNDVSCVIPYGGLPEYLIKTVKSAILQKFREIIVVNDGQPINQIETICQQDSVRVINLQKNTGLPNARNVGIKACQTRYVVLLDADDILCEGYIQSIIMWLINQKLRCACAMLNYIGESETRIGKPITKNYDTFLTSGFICEVSLFEEVGYYVHSITSEDFLMFRSIRKITSLTVCPNAYCLYRIHSKSVSSTRGKAHWAFNQLIPLYDSGALTLEEANSIANQFGDDGTAPQNLIHLFKDYHFAMSRIYGRRAYAAWLNRDFVELGMLSFKLIKYSPFLLRLARGKWFG
jgi:glycosyltransferase involved in cell wall biosynthesis